ncbi:MaoC/PaaZ C-terminal domain-containing protein [Streptomyces sp. ICBB 8177]|uniref:MaoC/PaaZ C-terminal domain-containing protein n=1 Tax=Streptomyces sp. ICBB 8177 TaxID=563922 RepID=UPI000D682EDC|nr:MaoC/PaaZ C-terminal domain-containing protein [Streptomyces sp. ICBB 8177]PWI43928.1 dehydratase [Streptomyces sp. ICBB 8177]
MTASVTPSYAEVEVGTAIPGRDFQVRLVDEIRYCGAGLDFVGVHWNERVARSVGMPHVVAHGPLTEAKALSVVNAWTGDPAAVVEQQARFLSPVLLPDDDIGARFHISGSVIEKLAEKQVVITMSVTSQEGAELAAVRVVVRLR